MLSPLLEPLGRSHISDEVEVVVKIRMDTPQLTEECALLVVFAFPTSVQPLALDTLSNLAMGFPTALPARNRTAKILNPTQD